MRLTLTAAAVTADTTRRTLVGTVYRYGEVGHTSAGPLAVGHTMPPPPIGLMVTFEHDREIVRGHVAMVDNNGERLRIAARVVDGELGDQALAEATSRNRAAFSLDIEDAEVVDGVIVSGRWEAIGQVAEPAFNSARIDSIAASNTTGGTPVLTDEQRARLDELLALTELTPEEAQELQGLLNLAQTAVETTAGPAAAPAAAAAATASATPAASAPASGAQSVAASRPAVPGGVPAPPATTDTAGGALAEFCRGLAERFNRAPSAEARAIAISAALADITYSAHGDVVHQPAWSGELWSGLQYEPLWSDLFNSGTLTGMKGVGWRFTSKLAMQDYVGDKTEIPTDNVTTESSSYTAARAAVGIDIDRAYFDLGEANSAFILGLVEQIRESWTMLLDTKIRAYVLANAETAKAVESAGTASTALDAQTTLLKAAAAAIRSLKRRRVGQASWVYVNDDDLFTLMDVASKDVSAFLELFGIDPKNFRSDESVPEGTVLAGVKPSATVRQLPGFPVILDAQNLAKGGVDKAAFGYWAVEEHHTRGITKVTFDPDFVPAP